MGGIEPVIARKEIKKKITTKKKTSAKKKPKINPRKVAAGHSPMEKKKTGNIEYKTGKDKKKSAASKKGGVTRRKNAKK